MVNLFVVSPPRSGADLVAETLIRSHQWRRSDLSTQDPLQGAKSFARFDRGSETDRLTATDGTPLALHLLQQSIATAVEEPSMTPELDVGAGVNTVDTGALWSMRLGLLRSALPNLSALLVIRSPEAVIASMMNAWASGDFVSVPDLPGWWGEAWSFPLVSGWRDLVGAPLAQVCAVQWSSIMNSVLDELEEMDTSRWAVLSFEQFLENPKGEIALSLGRLGLQWAGDLPARLPITNSLPSIGRVPGRRHLGQIGAVIPSVQDTIDRLATLVAHQRPDVSVAGVPESRAIPAAGSSIAKRFHAVHSDPIAELLTRAQASIVISTYKAGSVIVVQAHGDELTTAVKAMPRPMGIALAGHRLAIGCKDSIVTYVASAALAQQLPELVKDIAYAPRSLIYTGNISIHDMEFGANDELYFVNTRFSCLCRQDVKYSFEPVWQPPWISRLAAEDRCHLNGLALVEGAPRYVTALSRTDEAHSWRTNKSQAGVLVDIRSDEVLAADLVMPHSPRWNRGRLWVLESGKGTLAVVDPVSGSVTTVAHLPGFTRGLAFIGPYALVGLSQVRDTAFADLPLTSRPDERKCGVWIVDTRNGRVTEGLQFDGIVQELFDVRVLPHRQPVILDPGEATENAFVLADEVLRKMQE